MANWHYKHMDTLATISKRLADDPTLPSPSRELFLQSHELASTLKHFNQPAARSQDRAFAALCKACNVSARYQCPPGEATFQNCLLIRDHTT